MPANQTTQMDLALAHGMEAQLGGIVHAAERTVTLLEGGETSGMEENQLRNVFNVAQESQDTLDVIYFIRYQIGRARTSEHWQHNGFGLQVIDDIEDALSIAAQRAVDFAVEWLARQGQAVDEATCQQMHTFAHTRFTTEYLGFLDRAFVYIRKTEGGWKCLNNLVAERARAQIEQEGSDA